MSRLGLGARASEVVHGDHVSEQMFANSGIEATVTAGEEADGPGDTLGLLPDFSAVREGMPGPRELPSWLCRGAPAPATSTRPGEGPNRRLLWTG
jgi:hypothetical protein